MGQLQDVIATFNDQRGVGTQVTGFDAAVLRGGSKNRMLRSTIVGVILLDSAPDWERFRAKEERLTRLVPILRMRPLYGAANVLQPRLALDPDFDINLHLRRMRLPEGGTWDDVLHEARRMSLVDFDHDRPLWETVLIEGLPGERAAIIFKLHHALADGKATVEMGAHLLELSPEPTDEEMPDPPEADDANVVAITRANLTDTAGRLLGAATGTAKLAGSLALGSVREPRETWSDAANVVGSVFRATKIPGSEMSPLMTERGATYTFSTFDLPFPNMKTAAKTRGFTVNDVFLASCSTGLANYHERFGSSAEELRFVIPVSIKGAVKDGSTANEVALARFPLPVSEVSIEERLQSAHDEVKKWREEPALALTNQLMDVSWLVPVPVMVLSAKGTDVTTSNVPGPPFPIYLSGARVVGTWPLVATGGGAANITMVTYDNTAFVGVTTDDRAIVDPDAFVADLRAGFEEVVGVPAATTDPTEDDASHAGRVRSEG